MTPSKAILMVLSLIDLSLAGNLLLIVIFSGYENFVSKIHVGEDGDRPTWMGTVDFSGLKMKVIASIVAISAIALLRAFMELAEGDALDERRLLWLVMIHLTFVADVGQILFAAGHLPDLRPDVIDFLLEMVGRDVPGHRNGRLAEVGRRSLAQMTRHGPGVAVEDILVGFGGMAIGAMRGVGTVHGSSLQNGDSGKARRVFNRTASRVDIRRRVFFGSLPAHDRLRLLCANREQGSFHRFRAHLGASLGAPGLPEASRRHPYARHLKKSRVIFTGVRDCFFPGGAGERPANASACERAMASVKLHVLDRFERQIWRSATLNAQRGRIVSGDRLQAPADMRRALGVSDGDLIVMRIVDGELRVRPARDVLDVIQGRLRSYISESIVLSEGLIADRREAADRE